MSTFWALTRNINYYYTLGMIFGNSVEPQSHDEGGRKSNMAIFRRSPSQ